MTPPAPPFPLAAAWWRQHGLQKRLQLFRSAQRQPTPPRRAIHTTTTGPLFSINGPDDGSSTLQSSFACSTASLTSSATSASLISSATLTTPPILLMSACLLGYSVTYRGVEVRLPATQRPTPLLFLTEVLGRELGLVRCVPVCPEMELLGLPAPRPPLRLVKATSSCAGSGGQNELSSNDEAGGKEAVRDSDVCHVVRTSAQSAPLLSFNANTDVLSPAMRSRLAVPLDAVDGVVLKSRSPSCGVRDARLYPRDTTGAVTAFSSSSSSCRACSASCAAHTNYTIQNEVCTAHRRGTSEAAPLSFPATQPTQHAPATSTSVSFDLVDGFFAALLRNSLRGGGAIRDPTTPPAQPPPSPPTVTSDRLLQHYYAAEVRAPSSAAFASRDLFFCAGADVGLEHVALETFMESVLRHRNQRISQRVAKG